MVWLALAPEQQNRAGTDGRAQENDGDHGDHGQSALVRRR
jgi:hypothetical protein